MLDAEYAAGALPDPVDGAFIRRLHREFYRDAAAPMLEVHGRSRTIVMVPGEFRRFEDEDVVVGHHVLPSSVVVERFMEYFSTRFALARLSPAERLLALNDFSTWFLHVCLDQIRYMTSSFQLESLGQRLQKYGELAGWRREAGGLLVEVLHRGEIARGKVSAITGRSARTARSLLATLLKDGILGSKSDKGAVSLRFPIAARDVLFPRLFAPESA